MAAVDKTPKPCHHKQTTHTHGTHACYTLDDCRCPDCAAAETAYEQNRQRQHAYGRWDNYVDADPARQHVRNLMAQGMGMKRIGAVGGISQTMLWKLIYGKKRPDGSRTPSKRITKASEARVLAVTLDLADGAFIDQRGTCRRIQALVACGWSQAKLAARLGIGRPNFTPLAQGRRRVLVATARAVRDLYDELWDVPPPETSSGEKRAATVARNYAKEHGWLAPLWWDDIDTDPTPDTRVTSVPDVGMDEAAIWRRMHGDKTVRVTRAEAVEVVRRFLTQGVTKQEIQNRTGLSAYQYDTQEAAA